MLAVFADYFVFLMLLGLRFCLCIWFVGCCIALQLGFGLVYIGYC